MRQDYVQCSFSDVHCCSKKRSEIQELMGVGFVTSIAGPDADKQYDAEPTKEAGGNLSCEGKQAQHVGRSQ